MWFLVIAVIVFANGSPKVENTIYKSFTTIEECVQYRDQINRDPNNNAFAECFRPIQGVSL